MVLGGGAYGKSLGWDDDMSLSGLWYFVIRAWVD